MPVVSASSATITVHRGKRGLADVIWATNSAELYVLLTVERG